MRRSYAEWGHGIGRWWEILRAIWPRSRIPPGGVGVWSYPSPSSLFSSRRAAATRTSRNQSLRSPEPLRLRA
jgi:hypothetical protein